MLSSQFILYTSQSSQTQVQQREKNIRAQNIVPQHFIVTDTEKGQIEKDLRCATMRKDDRDYTVFYGNNREEAVPESCFQAFVFSAR